MTAKVGGKISLLVASSAMMILDAFYFLKQTSHDGVDGMEPVVVGPWE